MVSEDANSINVLTGNDYGNFPAAGTDNRIREVWVTRKYTKTTDTPGSGTWTPSGAPAVHYSTEEQVVGTWVDGKTVYQDTIYFQGSLPEGTTQVGVIQNAERFISVQGTFQQYANESDTVPSKIRQFPYQDNYGYSATIELIPNSSTNLTNVVLYKTGSWKIGVCAITIQYTKIS